MSIRRASQATAILCCTSALAQADAVLWTAGGKVTAINGSFAGSEIQPDTLVEIRMTYDDEAVETLIKDVVGNVENDFRTNLDLKISVKIGSHSWSGGINSGTAALPYTLFTRLYNSFPGIEVLEASLNESDGATFASFPFASEGTNESLSLKFSGPNSFLGVGIESLEIDPSVITSATGFIRSGSASDQLQFTIDPATVSVIDLADEPFAPALTIATPGTDFELTWSSDPRFNYRLEKSLTIGDWASIETLNGTGATITRLLPREGEVTFYRVVTFSKPR